MKEKLFWLPNLITSIRLLGAILLAVFRPGLLTQPVAFFTIYCVCGVTDLIDGWVARRTGTVSAFGSILDSIADLAFYTVMLLLIFPVLWENLPPVVWVFLGVILFTRLVSYAVCALKYRRFASVHSIFNKITGAGVFLLPLVCGVTLSLFNGRNPVLTVYSFLLCACGEIASIHELILHLTGRSASAPEEKIGG